MSSLSGVSLGGGPSLGRVGGWWDDLTGGSVEPVIGGSSGGDYAKQSPGALPQIPYGSGCPSGMMPDPVNPSQFCVYDAKAQQTAASCPAGTGYDPVTGKCAPKEWGGIQAGQCPAGQTPYNGKCVPVKQCPAGYNYALDKQACEKSYTTGSTGGGGLPVPKPQPIPVEPPPSESSFPVVPLIAGALLVTAAVLVIRKKRQKMAANEWEEAYLHVPPGSQFIRER